MLQPSLDLHMPWQKKYRRGRLWHVGVTIVKLRHVPDGHMHQEHLDTLSVSAALIPMAVSIDSSVACAYFWDEYFQIAFLLCCWQCPFRSPEYIRARVKQVGIASDALHIWLPSIR
ncbi:hypothetical protein PISMIDRAFT_495238 [Pisolithus microcarpus 441]|uniref:Uncharacterized protein n=1 Tax=Pisolithus microcarpus 441 TaxID=765257 RepID=A0A0C9YMK0_9AGAM|nr:hypothetical protein PISMIDRAFT_495238 [Pisolithus microcarpus 441]